MRATLDRLPIRTKLLGTFLLIVIVGALAIGWNVLNIVFMESQASEIVRQAQHLIYVQSMQAFLFQQGLTQKNFLLTGSIDYTARHRVFRDMTEEQLSRAQEFGRLDSELAQLQRLTQIKDDYQRTWLDVLAKVEQNDAVEARRISVEVADPLLSDAQAEVSDAVNLGQANVLDQIDSARAQARNAYLLSVGSVLFFLFMSTVVTVLAQQMLRPVRDLSAAAAAVETGEYSFEQLDNVAKRSDELGQLSRVFQRMAREVYVREQRLKEEVQQLRIEVDEARKAREVAEIVDSDYFRELKEKARGMRAAGATAAAPAAPANPDAPAAPATPGA